VVVAAQEDGAGIGRIRCDVATDGRSGLAVGWPTRMRAGRPLRT